ncbi:putative rhodanese-related sulfurtransferase [Campylobacter blaseri]|uniref:Rhodanese domain-containing protein n=1 Tax=Campylobacter blaseri TaxID=2042961 RepID=A0A2P8QYS5_9BACT|nr:rhodanese-like domain-containing protein [Campylobacter blaseri]PSM51390.1 hypothetical protein CQ405_08350 [Campylobacter blaseri]PSM52840.1 hypothetical protein CRN67_08355 [Campylobacter blaseri]QKF86142.1 putative rhodanese-related sulfurtransferase [Campylobacter blaseri]
MPSKKGFISTPLTNEIIKNKNIQIVDIRTPKEWEEWSLDNSLKIMFMNEDGTHNVKFISELNRQAPKDKYIALLCRTGSRTFSCATMLSNLGYSNIINLKGGIHLYKILSYKK